MCQTCLATQNCTISCSFLELTNCAMCGRKCFGDNMSVLALVQLLHMQSRVVCASLCNRVLTSKWKGNEQSWLNMLVCISNCWSWVKGGSYICAEGSRDASKLDRPLYKYCLNPSSVFSCVLPLPALLTELGNPTLSLCGLNFTVNFWTQSNLQCKWDTMWATQCALDFWPESPLDKRPGGENWQFDLH